MGSIEYAPRSKSIFLELTNLYRLRVVQGVSVPLIGSTAQTAGLFLAYSSFQQAIHHYSHGNTRFNGDKRLPLTIPQLAVAAAGAGLMTSFILCAFLFSPQMLDTCYLTRRIH